MSNLDHFTKKIQPYLDGSLRADELTEFEAFASTSPELMKLMNDRIKQLEAMKSQIPEPVFDDEVKSQLNNDIKETVKNLFKPELDSIPQKVNHWWSEIF